MRRTLVVTLALLCSFGSLAACGDEDDGGAVASDPNAPVTIAPLPVDPVDPGATPPETTPGGARLVNPTPGLDGVAAAAIDSVSELENNKLEVRFYGGVEGCFGVDHIDVVESDTDVTITVSTGTPPEAAARSCIEIAELQAVIAALASPLNGRTIIDGSSGAEVALS